MAAFLGLSEGQVDAFKEIRENSREEGEALFEELKTYGAYREGIRTASRNYTSRKTKRY